MHSTCIIIWQQFQIEGAISVLVGFLRHPVDEKLKQKSGDKLYSCIQIVQYAPYNALKMKISYHFWHLLYMFYFGIN